MTDTLTRWTVTLPYIAPPLTLNQRLHWAARSRLTRGLRESTAWLANLPALPSVHVVLHYRPADNRRRDPDNIVATLKPCLDGLVDAGIVPDDTPQFVSWSQPVIHPADKRLGPALWLEITA